MTHFFKNNVYEINGQYKILSKAHTELNDYIDEEWKNWDLLVLYNLIDREIEIKYCRKKNC